MKKIVILVTITIMLLSLAACDLDDYVKKDPITDPTQSASTPSATTPAVTTTPTATPNNTSDTIDPAFKTAMDSYEAFFAEYCDFMERYKNNSSDIGLILEYATMMPKYAECIAAMEAWDQEEMNDAELVYYLEVTSRIYAMLAKVAG